MIILRVVRPASAPPPPAQPAAPLAKLTGLLLGLWRTLLKKRSGWTRLCILLQVLAFTLYYFAFGGGGLWYIYMRITHGVDKVERMFIAAKVVRKILGITILLILMPILKRFNISDLNLLIVFNALHGLGFLVGGLSTFSVGFLLAGKKVRLTEDI